MFGRKYQPENSLQIKGIMSNTRISYKNLHLYARYTFFVFFFSFCITSCFVIVLKSTSYVIVRMIQYQTVIILAQLQLNLMFKAPQGQNEVCARMVTPDGRRL